MKDIYANDYVAHTLTIKTNMDVVDLSMFAPGTKFWWFGSGKKKNEVYLHESTISQVTIQWCAYRSIIINIDNDFPKYTGQSAIEEHVCNQGIEDIFFSKEECLSALKEYYKDKPIKIVEKVQPMRNIWEKRIEGFEQTPSYQLMFGNKPVNSPTKVEKTAESKNDMIEMML